jgi:hypothetical protein
MQLMPKEEPKSDVGSLVVFKSVVDQTMAVIHLPFKSGLILQNRPSNQITKSA